MGVQLRDSQALSPKAVRQGHSKSPSALSDAGPLIGVFAQTNLRQTAVDQAQRR